MEAQASSGMNKKDFFLTGIPVVMILFSLDYSYYQTMLFGGVFASVIGVSVYFGDEVYRMLRDRFVKR